MKSHFCVLKIAVLCLVAQGSGKPALAKEAEVPVQIEVPGQWRKPPFDRERYLKVPLGAAATVIARIPQARFLTVTPSNDILVSQPSRGRVWLVSDSTLQVTELLGGLNLPHGLVFHRSNGRLYLYVSESNEICRFLYEPPNIGQKEVIVSGLPDSSSPELGGVYGHELKNITIGPDDKLYVDIGSATNADPRDTKSDPIRGAIYRYSLDGSNREVVATGIRNAEGIRFLPGTGDLWAVVNERDDIRYPFRDSWQGSGRIDYGKVIQSYVDNHPPDEFIHVKQGANYGWPFANPNPDHGMDNLPFDPDYQTNPDWSRFPEAIFTRIDKGIQAHSAPLGFSFLQNTNVPVAIRESAVIALHGSWDRSRKTGYKIVLVPWLHGKPGPIADLVTGWLDEARQQTWGRPVDVVPDQKGNLIISDDQSGTIYRLSF